MCWFCLEAKQTAGLCIRTNGTCSNILPPDKKEHFPQKRKEKASHNMFIMLFVSLINDHVNYEEGFSKVGLKKWHLNGTNTFCLKIHGCSRVYISTLIKS